MRDKGKSMFITILVVRVIVVIRVTLEHVTFLRSETKKSTNHSRPALERGNGSATPRSSVISLTG